MVFLQLSCTITGDYIAGYYKIPTPTPALTLIWIGALFFVIQRYRMLEISPHTITLEILNSIEENIVLFNNDYKINWFNKTSDLFFAKILSVYNDMISMFKQNIHFTSFITDLVNSNKQVVMFRYSFQIENVMSVYDIVIKKVYDSFGDSMGYLMKADKVKSLDYLQKFFKITKREIEVIKLLITGLTYGEIAIQLNITENTLKTHITSFYNKLGINNKIELINIINSIKNS
ncbi:MAG: helix-turn-helix transcriptional regulator [Bacteroidales bacterium]|nr:helix-turn-helix transcriptional regulator [Bacteroidales bacterium]